MPSLDPPPPPLSLSLLLPFFLLDFLVYLSLSLSLSLSLIPTSSLPLRCFPFSRLLSRRSPLAYLLFLLIFTPHPGLSPPPPTTTKGQASNSVEPPFPPPQSREPYLDSAESVSTLNASQHSIAGPYNKPPEVKRKPSLRRSNSSESQQLFCYTCHMLDFCCLLSVCLHFLVAR